MTVLFQASHCTMHGGKSGRAVGLCYGGVAPDDILEEWGSYGKT